MLNATKRSPTLLRAQAITLGILVILAVLLVTSPSLAKPTPLTMPAQTATETTTINSTVTSTSSTLVTSTTSSTELSTTTSVTTVSSTVFSYSSGYGGGGIPGFPIEGILIGFAVGAIVLGLIRRRNRNTL